MKQNHTFTCGLMSTALLLAFGSASAADWPKEGTTNYVIHYVIQSINEADGGKSGKAEALEMVGTTANLAGSSLMDKMIAHCVAVRIASGETQYINGGCTMTDQDGDIVFTTFDTRELVGALPRFGCGTHTIVGGSGKYKGITGKEPFSCLVLPTSGGKRWSGLDIEHQMIYSFK